MHLRPMAGMLVVIWSLRQSQPLTALTMDPFTPQTLAIFAEGALVKTSNYSTWNPQRVVTSKEGATKFLEWLAQIHYRGDQQAFKRVSELGTTMLLTERWEIESRAMQPRTLPRELPSKVTAVISMASLDPIGGNS